MIFQTMARLLREQGQDPLAVIERGLERCPSDYGLRFLRARASLDAGRPLSALEDAETLRSVDPPLPMRICWRSRGRSLAKSVRTRGARLFASRQEEQPPMGRRGRRGWRRIRASIG